MAKKGGRQPGAGRPKGSTTKPRISDYLTKEDITAIVNKAKEMALAGNETMIKFISEHHFGKAIQPLAGVDGEPFVVQIVNYDKNDSSTV